LGRRRVSPVSTTTLPPFHVPYAAGFFGAASPSASPLPWPSPHRARLGSRLLPCGHCISTRQTSLHAADWWVAPSLKKARPHASALGSLPTPVGCYRGCLAPPLTGLAPASRREPQDARRVGGWRGGRGGSVSSLPSLNRACGSPAHGSPPSSRRVAFRPTTGVGPAS
jgi:hypothetical protein